MASPSVERTTKVEAREKKNDWFENVIRMRDTAEKNSIHKYTQKNIHTLLDHLSLLDMKCNLRKTIFMLMLTLSLGWNVQACASTRQRLSCILTDILQSTDVPLYYICNFKLVLRHYLFIVQSLLRHYICWTVISVLLLMTRDGERRTRGTEHEEKRAENLNMKDHDDKLKMNEKKKWRTQGWYAAALPIPSRGHII